MKNILFVKEDQPIVLLTEVEGVNIKVTDEVELVADGSVEADKYNMVRHIVTKIEIDQQYEEFIVDIYHVKII